MEPSRNTFRTGHTAEQARTFQLHWKQYGGRMQESAQGTYTNPKNEETWEDAEVEGKTIVITSEYGRERVCGI